MNQETPAIVFASANVADPRSPLTMYKPAEIGHFVSGMTDSFDEPIFDGGVELHPVMDLWCASPEAVAEAVAIGDLALNSLHASFRYTARTRRINNPDDRYITPPNLKDRALQAMIASPIGRILAPEMVNSSHYMAKVQKALGRENMPMVLYPQSDPRLDEQQRKAVKTNQKLLQPTDNVARQCGAQTPEEFVELLIESGRYDGFVLDTFHAQRRYGYDEPGVISNLDRSLPVLAPYVRAGHLLLGREDLFPGESEQFVKQAKQDVERVFEHAITGPVHHMLQYLRECRVGYVALEMHAKEVARHIGPSREDMHKGYAAAGLTLAGSVR